IEEGFDPQYKKVSESLFSIGNGKMGMRGNFPETYSGQSLEGNYLAGIYYPDKTKVGWWKNGYPEYFAKVLNAVKWIGLTIKIDSQILDLNKCEVLEYKAILDMKTSVFHRHFKVKFKNENIVSVNSELFYSMADDDLGVLKYNIKAENFSGKIEIESYTDFNVYNEDSNYGEKFWKGISTNVNQKYGIVKAETKKTNFMVSCATANKIFYQEDLLDIEPETKKASQKFSHIYKMDFMQGDEVSIEKYAVTVSSFFYDKAELDQIAVDLLSKSLSEEFLTIKNRHFDEWDKIWAHGDIQILGDDSAQQAIRYNILQLNQTYTGKDSRLNIGPKGFTGEKYGGSTYWDTEAYCLPVYLYTSNPKVPENLLKYRYNHLQKAIENAEKLGFTNGAALYPMVTMNGEECHNEWEITFEEIHRNGAIAYAIYNYTRFTGDKSYLYSKGLEVLIGISRFWAQRFNYSEKRQKYVILGVTGPNEYENNVNNNWYTNYIARWCIRYTIESLENLKNEDKKKFKKIVKKAGLDYKEETGFWKEIESNVYLPYDKVHDVFKQQSGFLDKVIQPADSIPEEERPISQHWSWDRILRSCFIKQADVLQGIYFFQDDFSIDEIKSNFDFYEPLTVHESSLSPCIHSILAGKIGKKDKAYEMFLRTSRLDLDDINNDTEDGCHITSMAGTVLSVIEGFGGIHVKNDTLMINPLLPDNWKGLIFSINFRGTKLEIHIKKKKTVILNNSDSQLKVYFNNKNKILKPGENIY
ncbi:MAG TPA: glycoside hydrolase family 65 protein, partial [Bacteroidetes bacterium]|nr:glycoside hydrolase family 65 protein [Bacteroidota bacterium]